MLTAQDAAVVLQYVLNADYPMSGEQLKLIKIMNDDNITSQNVDLILSKVLLVR